MEFKPKKFLVQAVESGDVEKVREAVVNSVKDDPANTAHIIGAAKYAEDNTPEIWEEHDNKAFKELEEWNKDYVDTLLKDMILNFSKERFDHLVKVTAVFYKMYGGKDQDSLKVIIEKSNDEDEESVQKRNLDKIKWVAVGAGTAVVVLAWLAYRRRDRRQY